MNYAPPSFGWARDHHGTVASYVNPNAHCPVCGAEVFFYRSPYNGRVYFDELGWPWTKHGCTDNGREPRKATRDSAEQRSIASAQWKLDGWSPLLSARIGRDGERQNIRGDSTTKFLDLVLLVGVQIEAESPIFVRTALPDLHQVTFLTSDPLTTRPAITMGFDRRLLPIGDDVLASASNNDPAALYSVGSFLLWQLHDLESARQYLEAAAAQRSAEAMIDLLVLMLFSP